MRSRLAERLLAEVMGWDDEQVQDEREKLELLSEVKYDKYARFNAGRRFIENLALWLTQFSFDDRDTAYRFVMERLVFISDAEMSHLVEMLYRDYVTPEFRSHAAASDQLDALEVCRIEETDTYLRLKKRSLFLGLSDGARTDELRRANPRDIDQDQIWHAYEVDESKASSMLKTLSQRVGDKDALFDTVWLVDDFSGSGKTYIRYDHDRGEYFGKIPRVLKRLFADDSVNLVNKERCSVYLILYVSTAMARSHITDNIKSYCAVSGFPAPQVIIIYELPDHVRMSDERDTDLPFLRLVDGDYYDPRVEDPNTEVGGTTDVRRGFSACALPVVLSHNSPNNSLFLLWGPDDLAVCGLFPRVSRHKEF